MNTHPLGSYALNDTPPAVLSAILTTPLLVSDSTDSLEGLAVSDSLEVTSSAVIGILVRLSESLGVTTEQLVGAILSQDVSDSLRASESLVPAFAIALLDSINLTSTYTPVLSIVQDILDSLEVVSSVSNLKTNIDVVDSLTVLVEALGSIGVALEENLNLSSTIDAINLVITILEELSITELYDTNEAIVIAISDSLTASTTFDNLGKFLVDIKDELDIFFVLKFPQDGRAYVVNTDSKALFKYESYDFNSFTELNGTYYGLKEDGWYTLSGEDDAGSDISAKFRTALYSFGEDRLKQFDRVYAGYTSDGDLIFKVLNTDRGELRENWYRLYSKTANSVRDTRVKTGKGIRSMYFGVEVENVNGADFEFDNIQFQILPTARRTV